MHSLAQTWFFVALTAFCGIYCLLVSRNILRLMLGVDLLSKAGVLALVACGQALGNVDLSQALAVIMIGVEVVVMAVGLALAVRVYAKTGSLDVWKLNSLKG